MSATIGVGPLRFGATHPSGRAEYPHPYTVGTPIGEHLRVEALLRLAEGRMYYRVNNLGPKWTRRKCWSCGNAWSPDRAQSCSYCLKPLKDLRFLMSVRWNEARYAGYEAMVNRRLRHFGLVTPVVVYYRAGLMLAVFHNDGERLLVDEPSPMSPGRLVAIGQFLCRVMTYLIHKGAIVESLSAKNLVVMPDQSVRVFDLDVLEMVPEGEAALRHPSRPVERALRDIAQILLSFCPVEEARLRDVLELAEMGKYADLRMFGAALEDIQEQFHQRTDVAPSGSLRAVAFSDVGLLRSRNEDAWAWRQLVKGAQVHVLADGMGGHADGHVAARLTCGAVMAAVNRLAPNAKIGEFRGAVHAAFATANQLVRDEGERVGAKMGSTLVVAVVVGNELLVCNTGDSRAYLFRAGQIKQVSRDHSVAQELVDSGKLSRDEARSHARAHMLTSNLGGADDDLDVETQVMALAPADRVLLCSDGLWGQVKDDRIAEVLGGESGRREAVLALVRLAYDAGGPDNITAVLIDVV